MKITLLELTHAVQSGWDYLKTLTIFEDAESLNINEYPLRFPVIVAQTTEGQIMDGPNGLRLITEHGTTLVDQTPDGYLVYKPIPHILQTRAERTGLFGLG